jgi:methyl-accepting chemotaxis protein
VADDELRITGSFDGDLDRRLAGIEDQLSDVRRALDDAGRTGERAGEKIESGAEAAADGLDDMQRAAERGARALREAHDRAQRAAEALEDVDKGAEAAEEALDDAAKAARRAGRALDEAGDEAAESGAEAAAAATGWERLTRSIRQNERVARMWTRTQDLIERAHRVGTRAVEAHERAWSRFGQFDFKGLGSRVLGVARRMGGFTRITWLLVAALKAVVAVAIVSFLAAMAAGIVSVVGGVASMSRGLLALIPILATVKVAMLAWKLAAEAVAPELDALKKRFEGIGEAVARGGLSKGLQNLARDTQQFAKVTETGFSKIGRALGLGATELGIIAKNGKRLRQVERVFDGMSHILDYLIGTVLRLGQVLLTVTEAATPAALELAETMRDASEGLLKWVDAANDSGKLTEWINAGYKALSRTVGVFVDIIIGVFNIFKIGSQHAAEFGTAIETAARNFRAWTSSAEGENAIAKYFEDAMPAFREMGLLLRDFAMWLIQIPTNEGLAPLLNQLRTEVLPALGEAFAKVSEQGGLLPSLLDAITELTKLFTSLDLTALALLAQFLANTVKEITGLIETVPGLSELIGIFVLLYFTIGAGTAVVGWATTALGWLSRAWMAVRTAMWLTAIIAPGVWAAITGPIGIVVAAIIGIGLAVWYLWENCEWFRNAVTAVWDAIVLAVQKVGEWFVWLWQDIIVPAWEAISGAIATAWNDHIFPVLDAIWYVLKFIGAIIFTVLVAPFVIAFNILGAIVEWVYRSYIEPMLRMWGELFTWLNDTVIQPVIGWIIRKWEELMAEMERSRQEFQVIMDAIGGYIAHLWNTYVQPVIDMIVYAWGWLMFKIMEAQFEFDRAMFLIGTAISDLWAQYVQPILDWIVEKWNWLGSILNQVKADTIDPVFDGIGSGLDTLRGWFDGAVSMIGDIWDGLRNKLAVPINFVIEKVWNKGILAVWNWIAEKLGLPTGKELDPIPTFATGGAIRGPGTGTSDSILAAVSNNEHVWTAEEVRRAGGHRRVEQIRRAAMAGDLSYYRDGGPVGVGGRDLGGGSVGSNLGGDWQTMWRVIKEVFPGATNNSNYRPGDPGYHGRGMAIDLGGPMGAMDEWIGTKFPDSLELIYTPGPYNIKNGRPHTYSGGVRADHYDHVHWAKGGASGSASGTMVPNFDVLGWIRSSIEGIINPIIAGIPFHSPPQFLDIPKRIAEKARDAALDFAFGKKDKLGGDVPFSGTAGSPEVMNAIRMAASSRGWSEGAQWNALLNLIKGESGFNPNAQNPTSTAYGLFQFLNSTWAGVGGQKTSNPALQSEYGMRYIASRYGNPVNAYGKWSSRSPHWYDEGGMLPPGLSMVMNGTGGPEPVFTPSQWDMLDPTQYIDAMQSAVPTAAAMAASAREDEIASLHGAVRELAHAVRERPPAMSVSGEETKRAVKAALAERDRERRMRDRYRYGD